MSYFPRTNTTIFTNGHRESWHNMIVSSWEIRSPGWLGHGCRSWHVSYKLLISVHREWYYREKLLRVLGITYHIITQKKIPTIGGTLPFPFYGKIWPCSMALTSDTWPFWASASASEDHSAWNATAVVQRTRSLRILISTWRNFGTKFGFLSDVFFVFFSVFRV